MFLGLIGPERMLCMFSGYILPSIEYNAGAFYNSSFTGSNYKIFKIFGDVKLVKELKYRHFVYRTSKNNIMN